MMQKKHWSYCKCYISCLTWCWDWSSSCRVFKGV